MSRNSDKVVIATASGITIHYTRSRKCWGIKYEAVKSQQSPGALLQICGQQVKAKRVVADPHEPFSPDQNRMLNDALRGLAHYQLDQVHHMSVARRMKIRATHNVANKVLNKWKQEIINALVDKTLGEIFYHSKQVKEMIEYTRNVTDSEMIPPITFSQLGITRRKIAEKLVNCAVLPDTFFHHAKAA